VQDFDTLGFPDFSEPVRPFSVRLLELPSFDPARAYRALREHYPGETFLLESVEGPRKTAQFSFMGFDPVFTFISRGNEVTINDTTLTVDDPYECLRWAYGKLKAPPVTHLPFGGGLVGYFGYDIARSFESLPEDTVRDVDLPEAHFIIPSVIICYDHLDRKAYAITMRRIDDLAEIMDRDTERGSISFGEIEQNMDRAAYEASVEKAREHIRAGDIFQVVPSRRTALTYQGDEFEMYASLRDINPSPYLFYLDFEETKIAGASPEMLVRLWDGTLTSRPIAGTRKRSEDPEEDEKIKLEMLLDEKERAEHVMLVDLHRNDLGRVSKYGTVKVDNLMWVEKFSHVQHIVSNVTGQVRDGLDCFDVLKACFPAGTLSGAPKIRAMEIIEELEPTRRGPYGGTVGYMDLAGNMDFAITIRTLYTHAGKAYIQAGAGIVFDSDPSDEYDETEFKMGAMLRAAGRDA